MAKELRIGNWRVRPDCNRLVNLRNDRAVRLEPKLMSVLMVLAERPGRTVRRDELFETVWADTHVGQEVLWRGICELRRILGDNPKSPLFIETVPRVGYRFIGPVTAFRPSAPIAPSLPDRRLGRASSLPFQALARPAVFVFGMLFGLAIGPMQTGLQVSDSPALEALSLPLVCCASSGPDGGHECEGGSDCCTHGDTAG